MSTPPVFKYTCSSCSEIHEGAPSFSYQAPAPYDQQPEEIRNSGYLGTDLCTFTDEDGEHYFIRVCLEIPIHDYSEPFLWGVWSSVSQSNYDRYVDTYDDVDPEDCYFGWLSNYLPFYPDTYAIKLDVRPRRNGNRPYIVPEETDHPLSIDFHRGLSFDRAKEIAEHVLHRFQ